MVCHLWVLAPQIDAAASSRMSAFSFHSQEQCLPVFLTRNARPTPSSGHQPCVPMDALLAGGPAVPKFPPWRRFCTYGSFFPASWSKWSVCVLHGTFWVTPQAPVGPPRGGSGPWWRQVCGYSTGLLSLRVPGPRTRCQLIIDI